MAILDSPIVSERYFFPRRDAVADPVFVDVEAARLACAAHRPHPDAPTVLHFHGNGEVVADWAPDLGSALAERGLNTFLAEYRGYGASTGRPSLVAMLGDVEAIFDAAGGEADRTILYGRSVGSIYAIHLAHLLASQGRAPAGLVIESGIADPLSRVLLRVDPTELGVSLEELEEEGRAYLDHEQKLRGYGGPTLVLHAAGDDLVDPSHARRNAEWSGGELVLFDRGDHNTIHGYNGEAIVQKVAAFAGVP